MYYSYIRFWNWRGCHWLLFDYGVTDKSIRNQKMTLNVLDMQLSRFVHMYKRQLSPFLISYVFVVLKSCI
jgi:hypothetical protein